MSKLARSSLELVLLAPLNLNTQVSFTRNKLLENHDVVFTKDRHQVGKQIISWHSISKKTTTAGLEPARAKPKRFLIFLLNRSDKLPR